MLRQIVGRPTVAFLLTFQAGTAPPFRVISSYLEMKTKIFYVLALAAVVHISTTWSLQDVAFLVIVVVVGVGFEYWQQHDQVVKQRTAQRAELITRLDRWQHDVKSTATQSGQPVTSVLTSVICRRVADYALPVPLGSATTPCTACGALVAFNPEGLHSATRPKICMQCRGIEPRSRSSRA